MKIENYYPLGNRVIIKETEIEEVKTKSGLILAPSSEKPKYVNGEIILMSNHIEKPMFKVGNIVCYNRLKADPIEIDFEKYVILHHDDVVFIVA